MAPRCQVDSPLGRDERAPLGLSRREAGPPRQWTQPFAAGPAGIGHGVVEGKRGPVGPRCLPLLVTERRARSTPFVRVGGQPIVAPPVSRIPTVEEMTWDSEPGCGRALFAAR